MTTAAKAAKALIPDDKTPSIHQALNAVMEAVGAVGKKDRNEQQHFSFRGVDAVVNAVSPWLRVHGVVVVPEVVDSTYGTVSVGSGERSRQMGHVVLTVRYHFYGPAGDSVEATVLGEAFDAGDKATPKAMSVAFRTALLQTLALPTDEPDPDSQTYERAAPPPPVTPDQLKAMHAAFGDLGITDRAQGLTFIADTVGHDVGSSKDLTRAEASDVIDRLKSTLDAAVKADAAAKAEKAKAEESSSEENTDDPAISVAAEDEKPVEAEQPALPENGEAEK